MKNDILIFLVRKWYVLKIIEKVICGQLTIYALKIGQNAQNEKNGQKIFLWWLPLHSFEWMYLIVSIQIHNN